MRFICNENVLFILFLFLFLSILFIIKYLCKIKYKNSKLILKQDIPAQSISTCVQDSNSAFRTNISITKTFSGFPLRLQNGCLPDQVPLGKQILSAEPYSVCPTAQVKRTLLRTLKFPASLLA